MHRAIENLRPQAPTIPHLPRYVLVEILEKSLIAAFFTYFCLKVLPHIDGDKVVNLILLLSEGVTAALVIFHRPTKKVSKNIGDWVVALSISFLPTFIKPMTGEPFAPDLVTVPLMMFGFLLQIASKLYIFRSFGIIPANRGVQVKGPYAFMRHPIYAGYLITSIGFLLAQPLPVNFLIYGITAYLQIRRIHAEEALLSLDPAYQKYKAVVHYRLFPGIY